MAANRKSYATIPLNEGFLCSKAFTREVFTFKIFKAWSQDQARILHMKVEQNVKNLSFFTCVGRVHEQYNAATPMTTFKEKRRQKRHFGEKKLSRWVWREIHMTRISSASSLAKAQKSFSSFNNEISAKNFLFFQKRHTKFYIHPKGAFSNSFNAKSGMIDNIEAIMRTKPADESSLWIHVLASSFDGTQRRRFVWMAIIPLLAPFLSRESEER